MASLHSPCPSWRHFQVPESLAGARHEQSVWELPEAVPQREAAASTLTATHFGAARGVLNT